MVEGPCTSSKSSKIRNKIKLDRRPRDENACKADEGRCAWVVIPVTAKRERERVCVCVQA